MLDGVTLSPRLLSAVIAGGLLCLLLAGCGGSAAHLDAAGEPGFAAGLPAPAELPRATSYSNAGRTRTGSNYSYFGAGFDDLVSPDGTSAVFSPVWDSAPAPSLLDAARAGYQFNLHDYHEAPQIEMDWAVPPADWGDLYLGLSDWVGGRWEWYQATGPVLALGDIQPYIRAEDPGLIVVLVLLGGGEARLSSIRVGPELWQVSVIEDTVDAGSYSSLAIDSTGAAHIAYYDATGGDLCYARVDGGGTHKTTIDSLPDAGQFCSLVLDQLERPQISYYDATATALKLASYNGTDWDLETVDAGPGVGQYCSMARSASGAQGIAYLDATAFKVKFASYSGTSWNIETLAASAPNISFLSLALRPDGSPGIAYTGAGVRYSWFDGSGWQDEAAAGGEAVLSGSRVLAFDSADQPVLTHYDNVTSLFYLVRHSGSGWDSLTIPSPPQWGTNASLAVDPADRVHLTCYGVGGLEYALLDGDSWSFVDVDSDGWVGHHSSLALDGDQPCISYYRPADNSLRLVRHL
jgi:hypothetical protein